MDYASSPAAKAHARRWLLANLREIHPSIRLGCVYGLARHLDSLEVIDALHDVEVHDPDQEVRSAASAILAAMGEVT